MAKKRLQGWQCSVCGKVWAFWVSHCDCHIVTGSDVTDWDYQPPRDPAKKQFNEYIRSLRVPPNEGGVEA